MISYNKLYKNVLFLSKIGESINYIPQVFKIFPHLNIHHKLLKVAILHTI